MLVQTVYARRPPVGHLGAAKIVASLTAVYTAYRKITPDSIEDALLVLCLFVFLDTITGVWCAFVCREAASKTMISKLVTKSAQYALLLGLAGGAALLAHNIWIAQGGLLALVGVEALSMLENLTRLQRCGGVNMGPAQGFLDRVSKYLQVSQPPAFPKQEEKKRDAQDSSEG